MGCILPTFLSKRTVFDGIHVRLVREGGTEVFVPDPDHYFSGKTEYLPATLPVWYNPKMELNRDLTVLALATFFSHISDEEEEILYIEALAGTGIRGFRVFNEVGHYLRSSSLKVIINDIDPMACKLMKFNFEFFGSPDGLEVFCEDANFLLFWLRKKMNRKINAIEIDPYGSPMPFVPAAAQVIGGKNALFLASSTDLAPLFGKFPQSALRKYGAWIKKNRFEAELASRILLYAVGREFSMYSKRFIPLFTLFFDGFIKIIGTIKRGKIPANEFWESVGWLHYKIESVYRSHFSKTFDSCEEKEEVFGPMWIGSLCNPDFCEKMLATLKRLEIDEKNKERLERFIRWCLEGGDIPLYINIHDVCRRNGLSLKPINEIVEELRNRGFRASRTFFDFNAVKVMDLNNGLEAIKKILGSKSNV